MPGVQLLFRTEAFSAAATLGDRSIAVELTGNADARVAPGLEGFVPNIHTQACRLKVDEVAVDLTGLEWMSSSCFGVIATWLSWIRRLPDDERYLVRFRAAADRDWQRPTLSALACFADDLVTVDTVEPIR